MMLSDVGLGVVPVWLCVCVCVCVRVVQKEGAKEGGDDDGMHVCVCVRVMKTKAAPP